MSLGRLDYITGGDGVRRIIGRIIFWFIKDSLDIWNSERAIERVNYYSNEIERGIKFHETKDHNNT
jgi:hypothetical protein